MLTQHVSQNIGTLRMQQLSNMENRIMDQCVARVRNMSHRKSHFNSEGECMGCIAAMIYEFETILRIMNRHDIAKDSRSWDNCKMAVDRPLFWKRQVKIIPKVDIDIYTCPSYHHHHQKGGSNGEHRCYDRNDA